MNKRGITPHASYRPYISRALRSGTLQTFELWDSVRKAMSTRLTPLDHKNISSGEIRARNCMRWEVFFMIRDGKIHRPKRGHYELTSKAVTIARIEETCQEDMELAIANRRAALTAAGIIKPSIQFTKDGMFRYSGKKYSSLTAAVKSKVAKRSPKKVKRTLKTGQILKRTLNGKEYSVRVCKSGTATRFCVPGMFEYKRRLYSSLTAIAKEITGYSTDGPVFFGV